MRAVDPIALFDDTGGRKYVCGSELPRFLDAARRTDATTYVFCCLLAFTGCRLSEALALTPAQLDAETGRVVFRTLKRRRRIFRAVPVPAELMKALCRIGRDGSLDTPLWHWCRQTAWRRVKSVMDTAGIAGPQATPKGLRHGFGVANAEGNVPMATTQKWLGHAKLETTAIYQQAVGREEHAFARRLWRKWQGGAGQ
jgi:integrase